MEPNGLVCNDILDHHQENRHRDRGENRNENRNQNGVSRRLMLFP